MSLAIMRHKLDREKQKLEDFRRSYHTARRRRWRSRHWKKRRWQNKKKDVVKLQNEYVSKRRQEQAIEKERQEREREAREARERAEQERRAAAGTAAAAVTSATSPPPDPISADEPDNDVCMDADDEDACGLLPACSWNGSDCVAGGAPPVAAASVELEPEDSGDDVATQSTTPPVVVSPYCGLKGKKHEDLFLLAMFMPWVNRGQVVTLSATMGMRNNHEMGAFQSTVNYPEDIFEYVDVDKGENTGALTVYGDGRFTIQYITNTTYTATRRVMFNLKLRVKADAPLGMQTDAVTVCSEVLGPMGAQRANKAKHTFPGGKYEASFEVKA